MRDLVFRNLTSHEKRKRIIASSEIVEDSGLRSEISRHSICILSKVKGQSKLNHLPCQMYMLRYRNVKEQKGYLLYRIKKYVYFRHNHSLFLAKLCNSLAIKLSLIEGTLIK